MAGTAQIKVNVRIRRLWPLKLAIRIGNVWPWMGHYLVCKWLGIPVAEYRLDFGRWRLLGHADDLIEVRKP